jgi:hypothetical protein
MIKGYDKGSNLTILDTIYGQYDDKDVMTVIYRDNDTGLKHHQDIVNPTYTYFMANDNEILDYHHLFIEKERVRPVTCKYKDLLKSIAKETGNLEYFYENMKNKNFSANKRLFTLNEVFLADMDINDYYRFVFSQNYQNQLFDLSKAYLDIEVRVKDMPGDEDLSDHYGDYPINLITLVNDKMKIVTTLILRDPTNPQVAQLEQEVMRGEFQKAAYDFVVKSVGGWKQATRLGVIDYVYDQVFYDDEITLLQDLFMYINSTQPDFVLAWNMAFDIPYIMERIKKLGYDPMDIMCHPDFKYKQCKYYIDEQHKNEFELKGDYSAISGYTIYMDQLQHFASRRKGQSKFPNYKLDTIGKMIAKIGKYEAFPPNLRFADREYYNFRDFTLYNIMDTIVQKVVEQRCDDVGYIFNKALLNNTRIPKSHRQTVYLSNRGTKEFYEDGLIMGCNANKFGEKPENKYAGALVGDPTHVVRDGFVKINGKPTWLFDNGDDFDFKALYPSEIDQHNIAPNTIIARVIAHNAIYDKENPFDNEKYDRAGDMFECLQSESIVEFCHRYLHLADYKEMLHDIEEFFTTQMICSNYEYVDKHTGMFIPARIVNNNLLMRPAEFSKELYKPAIFISTYNNMNKAMEGVQYEYYDENFAKSNR